MLIYWLLLAFPATMALLYPPDSRRGAVGSGHQVALGAFLVAHSLISALRYETGGDWVTYDILFDYAKVNDLADIISNTDSGYGLLMFVSDRLGLGIYFVNGFCSWFLGWGLVRAATSTRDPWLGITIAVPYLLIVVGMGYVRQGAAIGFILMALAALTRGQQVRVLVYLAIAASFHSTAGIVYPIFGYAMAERNKALAFIASAVGAAALYWVIAARIDTFETGYLDYEYQSGGAMVRQLMNVFPAVLMLLRWRHFVAAHKTRVVWLGVALANIGMLLALALSPSSTAVDRLGLYFSIILIGTMGEIRGLISNGQKSAMLLRIIAIFVAVVVQFVWLVFATHASFWVPYKWVFDYL